MRYQMAWLDNEHTILHVTFKFERITWNEIHELLQLCATRLDGLDHPADVIIDTIDLPGLPPLDVTELRKVSAQPLFRHDNLTYLYVSNMGNAVKTMVDIFSRMFPAQFRKMRTAATLDSALIRINGERSGRTA